MTNPIREPTARRQPHLQKTTDLDRQIRRYEHKTRECIKPGCGETFISTGPHNRMCHRCAASSENQTIGGKFI